MDLNVISIDEFIRILEKNVVILKTESDNADINFKFRDKLEYFDKLSCNVTNRIQSLLYLSEKYANNKLKQYVNTITGSWTSANNQVYEKFSKIRMVSRTRPEVPLSLLLEKMTEERSLMKESLHIHKNKYSHDHIIKCYALLNEIEELLTNLKRCDDKILVRERDKTLSKELLEIISFHNNACFVSTSHELSNTFKNSRKISYFVIRNYDFGKYFHNSDSIIN